MASTPQAFVGPGHSGSKEGVPRTRRAGSFARGQMLIMLAILTPVLLGVVAMGVDISVFYWTWSRMQSAADAAVLAGASSLPGSPSLAAAAATTYATNNGMIASEIGTPVVAADKLSISIKLTRTVPYYFGRVLGLTSSPVVVNATASLFGSNSSSGAMPIGLSMQTVYTYGQSITLHEGQLGAPGNWDGLALGGTGASNFSNNLANGYSGTISVGQVISSQPGVSAGPTRTGINTRISNGLSADPSGTFTDHTLTDPRVVIVPVVDWTGCGGSCSLTVKSFAALWITAVSSQGDITANFIGAVPPGSVPSPNPGPNFGTYRAILTQ